MTSDIAGEPLRTTQQGLNHDQVLHNGNMVDLADPIVGPTRQLGPLAKFSDTPVGPKGPSPSVGQHTEEIRIAPERTATFADDVKGPPPIPSPRGDHRSGVRFLYRRALHDVPALGHGSAGHQGGAHYRRPLPPELSQDVKDPPGQGSALPGPQRPEGTGGPAPACQKDGHSGP